MDQTRSALILVLIACAEGDAPSSPSHDAGIAIQELPFATEVIDFTPGAGSGFGQERFPHTVLGPPKGYGTRRGSTDVLSLGHAGSITLGFDPRVIIDEPGPDFLVFENPFWVNDRPENVFAELGQVEVSEDGIEWHSYDCQQDDHPATDCAGYTPTRRFDFTEPLDHATCGGDAFDLADVGLERARFVRITDLSLYGTTPSAGFDLDAVGLIHFSE